MTESAQGPQGTQAGMERAEALAILTAPGTTHELTGRELYGQPIRCFKNAPANLGELFRTARSDATFLVYENERLTFEDTWQRAAALANVLHEEYGVTHGDRVAISMRNYPEWVIAFMAATSIGAIAVAMNSLWLPEEMAYGLTDSGSKVLFADDERLQRFAQYETESGTAIEIALISVRGELAVPEIIAARTRSIDELMAPRLKQMAADDAACEADAARAAEQLMPKVNVAPDDNATIFYTSGSTGHPKGVLSCHLNILAALLSWELDQAAGALCLGIAPPEPQFQPAALLGVPLFHATGSHAVYLASYRSQRKLVCMYKWDPAAAAALIEAEQISSFVAPAAMTGDLIVEARRQGLDLSTLASVGGGGAPRAPEQVKSIDTTFANAMPATGWGMTETNAIGTGIGGPDYLTRPESSGRASAVVDLKVIDDAGNELPAGKRGELLIRGASVIEGYWNRPDANAETFVDGWLRTGDVAYLDAEGYLFIVDRIKDLVIRGGENIGCGEVEAALLEHPLVLEASVYGVPDERLGEEVGATYFAETEVAEAELRDFLQERLARFKVPRYLAPSDAPLPRTASGKILKRELRERALSLAV